MKLFWRNTLLGICAVWSCILGGKAQEFAKIDSLFVTSSLLNKHHYGFSLYDLDSNRFVFGRHDDHSFTPASNTKVYTLFSSLLAIGDSIPGLQYVERGDSLIFWGTGDPTFLHPKLDTRKVFNFLKFSDKKLFYVPQESSEPSYRDGWAIDDYRYSYQTDVVTFPIYGNIVNFSSKGKGIVAQQKYFDRFLVLREKPLKHFNVVRQLGTNKFELTNLNVPRSFYSSKPFIWSDTLFTSLLADTLHVAVQMLSQYDKPSDLKTIYSAPRNVVLRDMMLPSDNFLAEHLTMVSSYMKYRGFYTDSLRRDMDSVYYRNFTDSIALYDGSGLSRYNKVTPRNMVELLVKIKTVIPDYNQLFMFFPAGGVDGTLRNAYHLDQGVPFVWAKTGTLSGVHCQSGYIVTRTGRHLAFSFLNNNYRVSSTAVRKEIARVVTYIREVY